MERLDISICAIQETKAQDIVPYFALLDFTAGYHQGTKLAEASRALTAFSAVGGLYQWTRVAMGLKGAGHYFQRSMSNTVLAGLVHRICELYIDDVLIPLRHSKPMFEKYSSDYANSTSRSTRRRPSSV